jgi:hypothetical protein
MNITDIVPDFDFDWVFDPNWVPEGTDIKPWFLVLEPGQTPSSDVSWEAVLRYRAEKLAFIRSRLAGVDRDAALKAIMQRLWQGATSDRERFDRLVFFVQRMMLHPVVEQPVEADGVETFRHECSPPVTQAEAYPEDLLVPWMRQAYEEAKNCGWPYLGIWCSPIGRTLTGDWGMAGVPWDALEMLMVHEGRCGLQAAVTVQLAMAGGWRGRLLQLNHHRASELLIDGKWVIADADLWEAGFIGTTDTGELATMQWCLDHIDYVQDNWRAKCLAPGGYAYVLRLVD